MPSTLDIALVWTERAIALAVLLQVLELVQCRAAFSDSGVWRWAVLRGEHQALPAPLRGLFALVLPYPRFVVLLAMQSAFAVLLALGMSASAVFLFFAQVAVCVRFRGTFNGGSDYLTVLILMALSFAWLCGAQSAIAGKAALAYVAVQLTLSYFIAGLAKLKEGAWRSGEALRSFVSSTQYGAPPFVRRCLDGRRRCQLLSWAVLLFECGFPVAWLSPRACLPLLAVGFVFHIGNSVVFGLNRFLFAWSAAYPALFFTSHWLAQVR
jgi:hypothetical protein